MKKSIKRGTMVLSALLCVAALTSCNKDKGETVVTSGQIMFDLPADAPVYIMPNIGAYVFDGTTKKFAGKMSGTTNANVLTGKFRVGSWEMILLSNSAGAGTIATPPIDAPMATTAMWTTQPVGGYLPQMPELFYATTGVHTIVRDQTTYASANLVRNMAKVRIVIDEAYDFDLTNPNNKIILGNVPTTLSWTGKLMPDQDHPLVGEMSMNPTFHNVPGANNPQKSDTLDFVIPAHRGNDWEISSATDTTTVKLYLKASLVKTNSSVETYPKDRPYAEIPFVAKMNRITVVKVKIIDNVTISGITVLPWTIVNIDPIPY